MNSNKRKSVKFNGETKVKPNKNKPHIMEDIDKPSLTSAFDELTRNAAVLSQGIEKEFLNFVKNCGDCRQRWENAELECQRLNIELTRSVQEIQLLETRLGQARTMLDSEQSCRKKAENERDKALELLTGVRDLVVKEEVCKSNIDKIRDMTLGAGRGIRVDKANILSPGGVLSPICRLEVTEEKSVLDVGDLSYDSCDETNKLIESPAIALRGRKRVRSGKSTHKGENNIFQEDKVLSVVEEAGDESTLRRSQRHIRKSLADSNRSSHSQNISQKLSNTQDTSAESFKSSQSQCGTRRKTTSILEVNKENQARSGQHILISKTALKSEKCFICDKRVKFGKICLRCSACKLLLHCECEANLSGECPGPPPSPILHVKTPSAGRRRRSLTPSVLTLTPSSKRQRRQIFQSPMLR